MHVVKDLALAFHVGARQQVGGAGNVAHPGRVADHHDALVDEQVDLFLLLLRLSLLLGAPRRLGLRLLRRRTLPLALHTGFAPAPGPLRRETAAGIGSHVQQAPAGKQQDEKARGKPATTPHRVA